VGWDGISWVGGNRIILFCVDNIIEAASCVLKMVHNKNHA